jgi:hypothetical protein
MQRNMEAMEDSVAALRSSVGFPSRGRDAELLRRERLNARMLPPGPLSKPAFPFHLFPQATQCHLLECADCDHVVLSEDDKSNVSILMDVFRESWHVVLRAYLEAGREFSRAKDKLVKSQFPPVIPSLMLLETDQ